MQIHENQVNGEIEAWMGPVFKQLEEVSKEDLLRRIMQLECGHFIDYYREADDLNLQFKKKEKKDKPRQKSHEDEFAQTFKKGKHRGDAQHSDFVRLKIDRGRNDRFEPRRLLGLINDVTGDRSIIVGDINIAPKFSFFSVPKHQVARIYDAFATSKKAKGIRLGDVKGDRASTNNEKTRRATSHEYKRKGKRNK